MNGAADHPWRLVAPWYHWRRQGHAPRQTRPALQMYEHPRDVVRLLQQDPQRFLRFGTQDEVQRIEPVPAETFEGKLRAFADARVVPTGQRKLFLDTHSRFYLVVCELHCDVAGFPSTSRDQVCEAGFVIRRRRLLLPDEARDDAARLVKRIAGTKMRLDRLEKSGVKLGVFPTGPGAAGTKTITRTQVARGRRTAAAKLATQRKALREIVTTSGSQLVLEGWLAADPEHAAEARWAPVDETPDAIEELVLPLYPLIADPTIPHHAAQGRTLYYGLVPTGSQDHDAGARPRFDDRSDYEIRCFVRRHEPCCPRKRRERDCHGPLTWSEPTERYRLASHFDLVGTSNRPVTIQLPDLPTLKAQAGALPFGQGAGVKMVAGDGSAMNFGVDDGKAVGTSLGQLQICSFALPLITIVATFVLRLFLPIVVLAFGLFFLLKLKFCILPSVEVEAAAQAELDIVPPGIDADLDVGVGIDPGDLPKLVGLIRQGLEKEHGKPVADQLVATYSRKPLVDLQMRSSGVLPHEPGPIAVVEWEAPEEVPW